MSHWRNAVLLATAALALDTGCVFDTTGLTPRNDAPASGDTVLPGPDKPTVVHDQRLTDGPRRDGPLADHRVADQPPLSPDTLKADTLQPDTLKPDTLKPDTLKPDTLKPDTSHKLTCTERYGSAPGFILCNETVTQCRFYTDTSSATCQSLCTNAGGSCNSACEEGGAGDCTCAYNEPCSAPAVDQICTCTRP